MRLSICLYLFSCLSCMVGAGDSLRLNQLQVIGTHNSYRVRTPAALWHRIQQLPVLPGGKPRDLDYSHASLPEQFKASIRSIKLDLYADAQGGRFCSRAGMAMAGLSAKPEGKELEELMQPGCKVLHLPDFDFANHSLNLKSPLVHLRTWSEATRNMCPSSSTLKPKTKHCVTACRCPGSPSRHRGMPPHAMRLTGKSARLFRWNSCSLRMNYEAPMPPSMPQPLAVHGRS